MGVEVAIIGLAAVAAAWDVGRRFAPRAKHDHPQQELSALSARVDELEKQQKIIAKALAQAPRPKLSSFQRG